METVEVGVSVTISGREYRMVANINPFSEINEGSIRDAINAALKTGVGPSGHAASLLADPDFRKAMRDWNKNGRAK